MQDNPTYCYELSVVDSTMFIHLRVRSAYSMLESANSVHTLCELCERHHSPAIGITDHGNLFGAQEISHLLAKSGVQPIIGCTVPIYAEGSSPAQLPLIAQSEFGFRNLMAIVSEIHLNPSSDEFSCTNLEYIEAHSDGLICLSGGAFGPIGKAILDGQKKKAEEILHRLQNSFHHHFYIEIQRHGTEGRLRAPEEENTEGFFLESALSQKLPIVATNDVLFPTPELWQAHDALICIADREVISSGDRRRYSVEHHYKSPQQMQELFSDIPEAIANTQEIALRCHYFPEEKKPSLPRFADEEDNHLRADARAGLQARLKQITPATDIGDYEKRLEHELDTIIKSGFSGYFLIVADFIRWAKEQQIPIGPGRGSGAGSLVAYSLAITGIDPIRYGLIFERFLNPGRASMPDFDIDFCPDRRDEVIHYVRERYGADRVAQIITFGTLQPRAALRDVGRVLELPYPLVDSICRLVPKIVSEDETLEDIVAAEPRFGEEIEKDHRISKMVEIASQIEGLYRHASTHAAGVVIGNRPLVQMVPLYRDPRSQMPITQYSKKWVERAGLIKFDFLGLKNLSLIRDVLAHLNDEHLTEDTIPYNDSQTFQMLRETHTIGVFQLESTGMRNALRSLQPDRLEDIIALVALYRPGPMDNIDRFCACKHGREKPHYLHPDIEAILRETYGVIVYQEQVMQISQELAGFSMREADDLRRAMGSKDQAVMDSKRESFVKGAQEKGISGAKAIEIFELLHKFASYGFNKSHAAAYAAVSYQTAWLKANHPLSFMMASLNLDIDQTDSLSVLIRETRRMGIEVIPPCVNRSNAKFSVSNGAIIYALSALKNVSTAAMVLIEQERVRGGNFKDITDFAKRLPLKRLGRRAMESLIAAGCLDELESNRASLMHNLNILLEYSHMKEKDAELGQGSLFAGDDEDTVAPMILDQISCWNSNESMLQERKAIGFYLSGHPLDIHREFFDNNSIRTYAEFALDAEQSYAAARVAGIVEEVSYGFSKRNNSRLAYLLLSDASGNYEVPLFSKMLEKSSALLEPGSRLILMLEGGSEKQRGRINVVDICELNTAIEKGFRDQDLEIELEDIGGLQLFRERMQSIEQASGQGSRIKLRLRPRGHDWEAMMTLPRTYTMTSNFVRELREIESVRNVRLRDRRSAG